MAKARILLVEDERDLREAVTSRLAASAFEVVTASDGEEGLTKAEASHPNVIVLDYRLPKLNGDEVCAILKRDPRYKGIPILMLTARSGGSDGDRGRLCGANAYLQKPFSTEELLKVIQALLEGSS